MVKSFLKGADGTLFPLLPKVTTIGRENCDFTIQLPGIDYQHCILEYSEQDDCFVIQDLNTAQGTYVNDVRVQNAAVRLAPGDFIRFGYNGQPFELQVDNTQSQVTIPPVSQRPPAWSQPLTFIGNHETFSGYSHVNGQQAGGVQGLPHIYTSTQPQSNAVWAQPVTQAPPPLPRPPMRSRPLSAGAARRTIQTASHVGPTVSRPPMSGGWVNQPVSRTSSIPDLQVTEKDQRVAQLMEEVTRLRTLEFESVRKDTLIQQLQQQIGDLQTKIHQEPSVIMGGDMDMSARLIHLETEVNAKKGEVTSLREQLNQLQSDRSSSPQLLRQELGERVKEITQLRNELERVKKDKNITSGLVTQMQRDMSNKDGTISRLTREIEILKKDIRERDIQMSSPSAREVPPYLRSELQKTKENAAKQAEENSAREKELVSLRQKFKTSESKIQEQLDLIASLRQELEKAQAQIVSEKESQGKLEAELGTAKSQVLDVQRTERVVRVDLEQSNKRIERFRSRIIQVAFSAPGAKAPEKEMTDDELLECLKALMEERAALIAKVKDLESEIKAALAGKDELLDHASKLKDMLAPCFKRLEEGGRTSSNLKQEISLIQSLTPEASLSWIRDLVLEILQAEMAWETDTENALQKCGVNTKVSNDAPSKHIGLLYAQWESSLTEKSRLEAKITELGESHQAEMAHKLQALTEELNNKLVDAVEKAKLEGEAKLNLAIDEIRAAESEKRESCIEIEKRKIDELEAALAQLRNDLAVRQGDDQAKLDEAAALLSELEHLRVAEVKYKEEISSLENAKEEELAKFASEKEEMKANFETELESYKEQIKQHSVTICTLEERLEKLTKKNKDFQEQVSKLRAEKSQKPSPPPKPKVIIQRPREELAALEHVVNALRQENAVLKKEIRDSQDVIMGLRRDLSGASARLSDISGEMSEAQKQEMERNRELLNQRGSEMTELRQQMAKLSAIIDQQKIDIKKLEEEINKEKAISEKYKLTLEERSERLKLLEEELAQEKEEQKRQLDLIDQEGRITSELTSLGAQCRGERHEQIISRQREALSELRGKLKSLEQSRPPLPTQDKALQEVVLLKKQMAEMRVNQALAEDKIIQSATSLDREIGKTRGLITPTNVEADMERSAHRETMDALEASEATYLTLLRAMAASLDLEEIDGLRPMGHIPRDEREKLMDVREEACQLLANRIQVLKERISRKDELLQGYETDLAKLRQSQELAELKSEQVESLANDVRSRAEESEYLRESLSRTRDRLNQEKRLNAAIKQKRTFHLENEQSHLTSGQRRGLHCPIEDPKAVVKQRQRKELFRRKNYEIKTLKENLCQTEQDLYEKQKKLRSIETSMGLDRRRETVE